MSEPNLVLIRHGETEWSQTGRHTSHTDLPLLPEGVEHARGLNGMLDPDAFARVFVSPLQRARQTAELAGFGARIEVIDDLTEWDYGDYEGLTSPQIRERRPDWDLWRDGCPGGESPQDVAERADRVIAQATTADGDVALFAHGHILRVLAARWLRQPSAAGAYYFLSPATFSWLGHEHEARVLTRWNASTP